MKSITRALVHVDGVRSRNLSQREVHDILHIVMDSQDETGNVIAYLIVDDVRLKIRQSVMQEIRKILDQ